MIFSLKIEYVALILNCVLLFFYYEKNMHLNFKKKCYIACLALSMFSILVNILSVVTMGRVSDGWNFFLNSLYYPAVMLNASMLAFFLFHLMFEHVPQRKCSKIAYSIIAFFYIIVVVLTVTNIWTGCLFTVENGMYTRGVWNTVGYLGVGVELCMLVVCFFRNRKYINASLTRLIQMLPVAIALLLLIQMQNRDVMMNGIITAIANLILFIISQSSRMEQDALTELENRTACINDMAIKLKKMDYFQIITVNLRGFTAVNRKYGHNAGNEFLYQVARYLRNTFREGRVYRIGGVEFAVILPFVSEEYANHCCKEIYDRFHKPWEARDAVYMLKASICDMNYRGCKIEANQIVEQLQYAQNLIKEKKGTNMLHFDRAVRQKLERRKYLIGRMNQAIREDGFEMYYQPIYCWEKDAFTSMEALLRLRDTDGSLISPGEFIPIAEEVGLINKIGWIVLDKVCAFLGSHPELKIKVASVNMSVQQFMDIDFVDHVEHCLQKHQLSPERIRIEITERTISENPQQTVENLQKLTKKGIQFYLDDFGMGYSNFASVLSLPIETIKLDLTLVHGALESERKLIVLKSLIPMLSQAGYSVVAEGIETEEQADVLKKLGADRLQGYYYFKPMGEEDLLKLFG